MEIESAKVELRKFHIFTMARGLGIKFGPADINTEDLVSFSIINNELRRLQELKGQGNGRQQT